jgi:hypothetical protein
MEVTHAATTHGAQHHWRAVWLLVLDHDFTKRRHSPNASNSAIVPSNQSMRAQGDKGPHSLGAFAHKHRAAGTSFEPETIELVRQVLEDTVAKLPIHLRTPRVKIELAQRILKAAAAGERDPIRLRAGALIAVTTHHQLA